MGRRNVLHSRSRGLQTNIPGVWAGVLTSGLHGCMVHGVSWGHFLPIVLRALYQIPSFSFFSPPFHYSLSCVFFTFWLVRYT